ncbi:cytochrome P450 [Nocardia otitidiscaviarum]|uniref:cytochrome P450 n=1 Tax=Nocardia otitidiscaviarum TaxID=1823 RepID=UPI0004A778EE|nr:cytochrome P450 [Nocardia otitidiscaviarum]MBF6137011.1 cytochrome P450 [Nocardia otitidiscaviarum]MBF6485211.1 cytochrome P450 [Nocardia otitidiscaviarum]
MTLSLPDTRIRVTDIPHLDTPEPFVRRLPDEPDGFDRIELPSGHTAVCLSAYHDVRTLLLDSTSSRELCNVDGGPSFMPTNWASEVLINLDAPVHGVVRRFVSHEFSARALSAWEPTVARFAVAAFDRLAAAADPDLVRDVFRVVPAQTALALLGVPLEHAAWMNERGRIVQYADRDDIAGIETAWIELWSWVGRLLADDSLHDDTGLLAVYKRRAAEPEFAAVDTGLLQGTVMGIVLGGDNNIATMLAKTAYAALAHPPLYRRVAADPVRYVPRLVDEILRLMPLGTPGAFPRMLTNPLVTAAGALPAGSIVYPWVTAANRDPEVFPDPLVIDLERPARQHLQYGYGMHRCMGSALSQMELIAVLTELFRRCPDAELAVDPAAVPWDFGIGLRRPAALPIRPR